MRWRKRNLRVMSDTRRRGRYTGMSRIYIIIGLKRKLNKKDIN
jgi:hypothetical protein